MDACRDSLRLWACSMNVQRALAWLLATCLVFGGGRGGKSSNKEATLDDLNRALVIAAKAQRCLFFNRESQNYTPHCRP